MSVERVTASGLEWHQTRSNHVFRAQDVVEHGVVEQAFFAHQFQYAAALQVLADLGLAQALVLTWLWRDARAAGRNPVPWVVLTLAAGSFGPLLYLLTRRKG